VDHVAAHTEMDRDEQATHMAGKQNLQKTLEVIDRSRLCSSESSFSYSKPFSHFLLKEVDLLLQDKSTSHPTRTLFPPSRGSETAMQPKYMQLIERFHFQRKTENAYHPQNALVDRRSAQVLAVAWRVSRNMLVFRRPARPFSYNTNLNYSI
jgi:hypothetical protein